MITFARPIWNSKTNTYVITLTVEDSYCIQGDPQYLDISSNDIEIEHPDVNTDIFTVYVKNLVNELIKKNTEVKWFATTLREGSILRRLEHKWKSTTQPPSGWFTAKWVPSLLEITTNSFMLSWTAVSFEASSPRISSRFLSLSEPPTPRSVSPQSQERSIRQFTYQPGQTSDLEQVFDIPLTQEDEVDLEEQKRERQMIREARLRVELSQMKLEKHLQTYYNKYGNIPDETDSESSESSFEED
jgi:hypothetical protein